MSKKGKTCVAKEQVNHPEHYNKHPSGVECIDIIEHMSCNPAMVIKYIWRNGLKDANPVLQELEKAKWYLEREIQRIKKQEKKGK